MRVIAVDDDKITLDTLINAIKASPDVKEIAGFTSCTGALQWADANRADMAFLSINMQDMNGLALAERIRMTCPECKIVFCTECSEYALEAFRIHATGYLLKPITAEQVQNEIDYVKGDSREKAPLTVQCFGNFEVFYRGEPLAFRRTKTKELLAFLVDRKGSAVTAKQICSILWENDTREDKNVNYLYQLFDDLRHSLRLADVEELLNRKCGTYAINRSMLDCDYYRYLECGTPEYLGEYMVQYNWAAETGGRLREKISRN